jgi:cell wall-associated NlpC family hydrolase|tara:strand:- start:1506 stop:2252 length:747 start_codon:yes stop_codon:yes gene_type:complete
VQNKLSNNYPIINLYKKKSITCEIATQMLHGENFSILRKFKNWYKIKLHNDNYVGFIIRKKFTKSSKSTHKVSVLAANIYGKPSSKAKQIKKLTFSSKICAKEKYGSFIKFKNQWIRIKDLKPVNYKNKNIFSKINLFKEKKYKWGGKNFNGVDCSGLVQLFFNFNNKFCPRDAKDQLNYFKKKVKLQNIKKNDLIFWQGHVAIILSKNKLIHAYGPSKKVLIMNINYTIKRIEKTAKLKVIGIRRIN